jgi:hypothetical protein
MTWGTLLLLGILVSLDMQNLASRWGRVLRLGDETSADYTLVVPIFGDPKYFRNGDSPNRHLTATCPTATGRQWQRKQVAIRQTARANVPKLATRLDEASRASAPSGRASRSQQGR